MLFHSVFMNIDKIANINSITINRKIVHVPISSCYFMLLTKHSFEMFPKHNEYGFILNLT